MPGENVMAVASWAGQTIVAAAVTDVWEAARARFAQLLGRGDPRKTSLAERRLAQTRDQLSASQGTDLESVRAVLEAQWVTRLADLLDEEPDAEAELSALVGEIRAMLPGGAVSAAGEAVAAGRDVNITASGSGVATGVIHGNVTPANPTGPGPATT